MACHGLSLLVGRSGAHTTHFQSKIIAPVTTLSTTLSIDCVVCHPNLAANLGPDHVVCIHGTSNAWLPGKVPVIFNTPLPPIGVGDFYALGPLGGTGTCVVYCHSNGQTPPNTLLTAGLGYPGSNLPLPWNVPFPVNPVTLDCGCCHGFPPLTHSADDIDCSNCHPTPLLGITPTNAFHINGMVDFLRTILSASPAVPLIAAPSPLLSVNNFILTSAMGIGSYLGLPTVSGAAYMANFYDTGRIFFTPSDLRNTFYEPTTTIGAPSAYDLSINNPFTLPLFLPLFSPVDSSLFSTVFIPPDLWSISAAGDFGNPLFQF
jgi:hypothetical protein